MKFTPHIPSFMEGTKADEFEFETLEQLVVIPEVARWMQPIDGWPFYRLSLAYASTGRAALMAEYAGGVRWWTVGYIQKPVDLDLPRWEPTTSKWDSKGGWEGRWSNIDRPDFGPPPPSNFHTPSGNEGIPYRLGTELGQEIDLYMDRPMPVEFVVAITKCLDDLLRQQPDVKRVSLRMACETE